MNKFIPNIDFSLPYIEQLKQLVANHHTTVLNLLNNNKLCKNLANWINELTPILQDPFFKWSTKCKWILDNMTDFIKCESCGKIIKENISLGGHFHTTCSKECNAKNKKRIEKSKATKLKLYGNEFYANIELRKKTINLIIKSNPNYKNNIVAKSKATKLKRYGNEKYVNLEKRKLTNIDKYGVDCVFKSKEIQNKIANTNEKLYGSKNVFASKQIQDKIKQSNLKNFGVEYSLQSNEIRNLIKQTNLKKYGYEQIGKVPEIKVKIALTNLKKYGYVCPLRNEEIKRIAFSKYKYNDIIFDSSPELAMYIYLKDNNILFIYLPNIILLYEYNRKIYYYHPDFLIENELVELKGNQFLKEDGTWQNPYNHKEDKKFEAKHLCLIKNNIKILYSNEYQFYLDYINQIYGNEYLLSFKISLNKKDVK